MWEKATDKQIQLPSLDIKRSFLKEKHTEKCNGALCFRSSNYNTSSASMLFIIWEEYRDSACACRNSLSCGESQRPTGTTSDEGYQLEQEGLM